MIPLKLFCDTTFFFTFYNSALNILCIRLTLLDNERSMNSSPICTCKPPKIEGFTRVSMIKVSSAFKNVFLKEASNDFNCALVNASADVTTDKTSPRDARISSAYLALILLTSPRRPFSASVPKNATVLGEKVPVAQMASMSFFLSALRIVGFSKNRANVVFVSACPAKFWEQEKKKKQNGSEKNVSTQWTKGEGCGCALFFFLGFLTPFFGGFFLGLFNLRRLCNKMTKERRTLGYTGHTHTCSVHAVRLAHR